MSARLILVGLVVGFGVDLPDSCLRANWLAQSQEWLESRRAEFEARLAIADTATAPSDQPESDLAFSSLMDQIARELEAIEPDDAPPKAVPVAAIDLPEDVWAEIETPEPIVPASVEPTSFASLELPESLWAEATPSATTADHTPSLAASQRFSQALKLTGAAFQAWMSLVVVEPGDLE